MEACSAPLSTNFFVYSSKAQLWTRLIEGFTLKEDLVAVFEEPDNEGTIYIIIIDVIMHTLLWSTTVLHM